VTDHLTSFFPTGRDRGVTVAVEGFFPFVWFGWGQAVPPSWLVVPLAVGDGLAPSTVTGAGAGLCLLAFGLATLLTGGRAASATDTPT
jgi:hypothetical protein